jgi:hypothetical protein
MVLAANMLSLTALATVCTASLIAPGSAAADSTKAAKQRDTGIGFGISAGGGLTGFTDETTRDFFGTGPTWDVRVIVGARQFLALEASYVGSSQSFARAERLPGVDSSIVGTGIEADLRVNLGTGRFQPYGFAGLGWMRYDVRVEGERANVPSDDDILTIPVGAGVTYRMQPLLFDARATYRRAYDDEMLDPDRVDVARSSRLDSWTATARIGLEF